MISSIFYLSLIVFISIRVYIFFVKNKRKKLVIGFFHPYCNDGGGGERVLWKMLVALHELDENEAIEIVVYSGDKTTSENIISNIKDRFEITMKRPITFSMLHYRTIVEPKWYPRLTMIGQSLASIFLGLEALLRYPPDVLIDTMGFAFTFPVFRILGGCTVAAYVHYPTISTDMLQRVNSNQEGVNNDKFIANSLLFTNLKLIYYQIFAKCYGFVGRFSNLTLVNSSWTQNHIKEVWNSNNILLVYPPVDCERFEKHPLDNRNPHIISIGQFRPEKNHLLQIESFEQLLKSDKNNILPKDIQLILVGSVRNHSDDKLRLDQLKLRVKELGLEEKIKFVVGASNTELQKLVSSSLIGLHTMKDEHFGIGIVEMMASGLIPIANNSAGPKEDIVKSTKDSLVGFLASTKDEYVSHMLHVFSLSPQQIKTLQSNARNSAKRFSDERFNNQMKEMFMLIPEIKKLNK